MHGVNAEQKGHSKTYRDTFYCGCPVSAGHGTYVKKLTHKLKRRETKQLLHTLKQEIDALTPHLEYQFANNEEAWTTRLDSC